MATTYYTDIQKLYVAYFGRPADVDGLNYWEGVVEGAKGSTAAVSAAFAASAEYKAAFNGMTASAVVTQVYANLFGTTPDTAGLTYWSNLLATGQLSINNIVKNIADGALGADKTAYANKVTAAMAFTAQLDTTAEINGYAKPGAAKDAKAFISGVTTDASLAQAINPTTLANTVAAVVSAGNGGTAFSLTALQDSLTGSDGNDTFTARIFDNQNTYQSGDRIDGGAGTADRLNIDVANSQKFAITGETTGVEQFSVRAQAVPVDTNNNNLSTNIVQIDAQRMSGVNYWESSNSRADVVVEDVRILANQITRDITIAFVESDPGHVDFGFYFDQYSLRALSNSSATLSLQLMDTRSQAAGTGPLKDSPYNGFAFLLTPPGSISAKLVTVQSAAIDNAQTYAELVVAINAALQANPDTKQFTAALGGEFTVSDTLGTLQKGTTVNVTATDGSVVSTDGPGTGWVAAGAVPPSSGLHTRMAVDRSTTTDLVTSKIILDDVGRGSTSGDLVVGGLSVGDTSSSKGVQRFEIEVRDNSKMESIASTNNTLREVTIKNGVTTSSNFAYQDTVVNEGNLTVNGNSGINGAYNGFFGNGLADDQSVKNAPLPGVTAAANTYGFSDVRLIDASEFKGKLAFTAEITAASIAKYLNLKDIQALPAGDNVDFIYTGGNDNDTMQVILDSGVVGSRNVIAAGREDFTFTANGGDGDDSITVAIVNGQNGGASNWYNNQKLNANISVNGGTGNDTIWTPGAGDAKIDAGAGNDTVYTDNTGAQAGAALATASGTAAAAAYRDAAAAELAKAITVATLANNTDAGAAQAIANNLNTLNLVTPVVYDAPTAVSHAAIATATQNAFLANAITAAQKIALDTAYNAQTGGTVVAPTAVNGPTTITGQVAVAGNLTAGEQAAGDALLATYIAVAKANAAIAVAADSNTTIDNALLNATQLAVETATIAVNGVAVNGVGINGTATILAALTALNSAITVGATDAAVLAAVNTAITAGGITAAQGTTIYNAAIAAPGTVDATEVANVNLTLAPLLNTATNNNTTATAALATAISTNATAVNTAATIVGTDPVNATASAIANDFVGSVEAAAAAAAARTALNTFNGGQLATDTARVADLATLKSAIATGATELAVNLAVTNAVAKGTITGGVGSQAEAILNATNSTVPTAAGTVDATEKLNVDLLLTSYQLNAETALANDTQYAANLQANVTATALASAQATAAANLGGGSYSVSAAKGIYVFNTANQASTYVNATNDERNAADLRSDVNNTYNLYNSRLTVNFLGLEKTVTVDSTGFRTTDLQINQAIKNAINNDAVLSKLLVATDGPANTLVVTSLIDGNLALTDLSVTLATPTLGTLTAADISGAAAAYGFVGAATEATLLGAGGLMTLAKASFDTKGDYVRAFAETGAAGGNGNIVGANSTSSSDNTVTGGTGNDVIVLGTTLGLDSLASSNERVVYNAPGFGDDTIVHFSATGLGIDQLDFSALRGSASQFGSLTADRSIVVAAQGAAPIDAAAVAALFTDSATAISHVYVSYDAATNIGRVFTVADAAGVAAGSVTATLVGTIDLANTGWGTLTAANFV